MAAQTRKDSKGHNTQQPKNISYWNPLISSANTSRRNEVPDARGNAPSRIASVEEGRLPVTPSRSCLARTHARHKHETKKKSRIETPGGLFPQPAPQQKHRVCCSLEQPYSRREANRTGESETVTKRIVHVRGRPGSKSGAQHTFSPRDFISTENVL